MKSTPGQPFFESLQKLLETRALGTKVPGNHCEFHENSLPLLKFGFAVGRRLFEYAGSNRTIAAIAVDRRDFGCRNFFR